VFDAGNDGIGLAPFHEAEATIPEAVKTQLQEIAAALRAGKIKINTREN